MTSESQRKHAGSQSPSLPLCARRDLRLQEMQFQGGTWQVVKDPLALQYFRIREAELRALELLNGTRKKRHRILIAAAGIYIEVLISALALFLWSWTQPGLLHVLLMNTFMVTAATTVIYNANPLLRYDGYYMLADWLEIPNLRSRADREMQRLALKVFSGVDLPDSLNSPTHNCFLFVTYAVCSMVNRWVMVLVLTGCLYHLLKPVGLQKIALVAPGLSVAVSLYRFTAGTSNPLSFAGRNAMKPARLALTLMAVIAAVTASLMLPIPVRGHAPLVVEPAGMRNIYSQADGVVEEIMAKAGESVSAGQPLLRLRNDTLELELAELELTLRKRQVEAILARTMNDSARLELAVESIGTVEEELNVLHAKLDKLTVRASFDGVLIEPVASASRQND